ncbi:hypothetical protein [Gilvimarinus algae]|uniref:Lipoprotein n=1 Tax=Gilvimarinus algae TaxID=3058037 RepID=A0ABT8TBM2_9GAMM|nr:hypothetical protein [Gilvimarinus sp. SDUM040014]MDO3380994.1 hypothetical protein [Gilvimarinus sp. SDUM040014]
MKLVKTARVLITNSLPVLLGAALLAGCSSTPSYGNAPEQLTIRILPNTSKQFVYRVGLSPTMDRNVNPQARPSRAPGKRDYRRLQERTAYVVAATGFCREGYLELDFRLSNYVQWLRGECREGASEADLRAFAERNTLPLNNLPQ